MKPVTSNKTSKTRQHLFTLQGQKTSCPQLNVLPTPTTKFPGICSSDEELASGAMLTGKTVINIQYTYNDNDKTLFKKHK